MQALLNQAVERGIITASQTGQLLALSEESSSSAQIAAAATQSSSSFSFTNVLYYLGGLIAIGAMSLFMTFGWGAFGGWGIAVISLMYAGGALYGSRYLAAKDLPTPAGILAALAIALIPLAIYGIEEAFKMWLPGMPYRNFHVFVDWRWAYMELGTLAAGSAILFVYRMPFAVMPIAVTLWYMSMDFAPFLSRNLDPDFHTRKLVSIVFGLAMLAVAVFVDIRSRRRPDYAFWLYLFGTLAFWGGLSTLDSGNEFNKFMYALINVGMILLGGILARRIFTVCGSLGLTAYLGYLSYTVFKDSLMFPFALTALGLGLVGGGIWWQRHEAVLNSRFRTLLPEALRAAL